MESATHKPKLVILGASHAKRLLEACKNNEEINSKFQVIGNVQSGATWQTLKYKEEMLKQLKEEDTLVVQFLGNDLLVRNILITPNPKIIHLTKFVPRPDSYVSAVRCLFKEKLATLKCKILIIDDPYRHLFCCESHVYKGLVQYFAKRNAELKQVFSEYQVIDHRNLMDLPFKKLKCIWYYSKLLEDTVHFKPVIYQAWARSLSERYLSR